MASPMKIRTPYDKRLELVTHTIEAHSALRVPRPANWHCRSCTR